MSCESKSIRPHLGERCAGHGVEERITRYVTLIARGSRGKDNLTVNKNNFLVLFFL